MTGFDVSFHIKNGVYLSQSFHSTTCHGVCHNPEPPKQAKKSVDKDKQIGELKSRFSQNEITLEEYVRGISAHTAI